MHRMHANRVSAGGTSAALDDSSIQRINERITSPNSKRAARTPTKKVASTVEQPVAEPVDERIVVASLNDIPAGFERIGTGFYRNAHHVWQLMPADGGYVLLRKQGEDHVLGFDPEPVAKTASVQAVVDRHGNQLKVGARVKFPYKGKIADATVIVVSPGVLEVDVGGGQSMDVPPDMTEWVGEEAHEPEHGGMGLEEGNPDLHAGAEFQPDVEPSSKAASKRTAIGEPAMEQTRSPGMQQPVAPRQMPEQPAPQEQPSPYRKERQISFPQGTVAQMSKESRMFKDLVANQGRLYLRPASGGYPWYEVELREGGDQPVFTVQALSLKQDGGQQQYGFDQLKEFESNLGSYQLIGNPKSASKQHDREVVLCIMANVQQVKTAGVEGILQTWKDYWRNVGQRVAQKKPLTQEQKERRKQKRRERRTQLKGLPPGSQLGKPSKMIHGQMMDEEPVADDKLGLYEQLVDELRFILEDEAARGDDVILADEVSQTLQQFDEDMERLEQPAEQSLDAVDPMGAPSSEPPRMASRAVVSMADLTKE